MPCYDPLKGQVSKATGGITFSPAEGTGEKMAVACGQCLGCRLDRSRLWAARLVHESTDPDHTLGSVFITLTYRDPSTCNPIQLADGLHIPSNWSLDVSHVQKFLKRLRKSRGPERLRYFLVGEYGEHCRHAHLDDCEVCNVGRPHYHAILFNVAFPDMRLWKAGENPLYESPELEKLWGYGFCSIGSVSLQSAGYVARYCLKKITGRNAQDHYQVTDDYGERVPVRGQFATMSRGYTCRGCDQCGLTIDERRACKKSTRGIGARWIEKYKDDVFPSDELPVPGHGIINQVPKFYESFVDPALVERVKAKRQEYRDANLEEFSPERLYDKYRVKRAQIKTLRRQL